MKKLIIFLTLLSSCMFKNGDYQDDNLIEELGEAALNACTGIDVDFTPSSEEKPILPILKKSF